jgi:hypothetical protein
LLVAKDSADEQRKKIRKMADTTLKDLYKLQPVSRTTVQKSAGYAVFNNMGTNLLLLKLHADEQLAGRRRYVRRDGLYLILS